MLWCALLITELPRKNALEIFREVVLYIHRTHDRFAAIDITHSGLESAPEEYRDDILRVIAGDLSRRDVLRPLLFLKGLPARRSWLTALGPEVNVPDWRPLMRAVLTVFYHQSQEATDCRWLRLVTSMAAGRYQSLDSESAREILEYPDYGDQAAVRPSIRAAEMQFGFFPEERSGWPEEFWKECLLRTPCLPALLQEKFALQQRLPTIEQVDATCHAVISHCNSSRSTTAVDARHDTAFGIALYALRILRELLNSGGEGGILGRLALRTLAECAITLAYLKKKDEPELWRSFRVYGAGQSKLAYLKLEELEHQPSGVDLEFLKTIAGEDQWDEYLSIDLGNWADSDLRRLSELADVKVIYDQFYSWLSTYSHGHWGAARESVFGTCANSLHRFHRIPVQNQIDLMSVAVDACTMIDKILAILTELYPGFPHDRLIGTPSLQNLAPGPE
jgi:hypothetical protein